MNRRRDIPAAEQGRTYANSRLRAVRASPRHPIALPPLETIRQSAGLGVAVAAAATSTVGSGAGDGAAALSAQRTPFRYYPSAPLKKIASRANLGPLRADFPSPPEPPLPDRAGPDYRAHSKHSALWAVAPTRRGKAAPCLCAVLWDRELSLWGACVLLWLGVG
jgi:hypothetical protein